MLQSTPPLRTFQLKTVLIWQVKYNFFSSKKTEKKVRTFDSYSFHWGIGIIKVVQSEGWSRTSTRRFPQWPQGVGVVNPRQSTFSRRRYSVPNQFLDAPFPVLEKKCIFCTLSQNYKNIHVKYCKMWLNNDWNVINFLSIIVVKLLFCKAGYVRLGMRSRILSDDRYLIKIKNYTGSKSASRDPETTHL